HLLSMSRIFVQSVADVLIWTHEVGLLDSVVIRLQRSRRAARDSAATFAATEFVFFATITRARCVTVGYMIPFGGRRRALDRAQRRAARRSVSGTPWVHQWEPLLVSPDHGFDDGTPKSVDFLFVHLGGWLHFAERLIPPVFR